MKTLCAFFMIIITSRLAVAQSSVAALATGLNMRKAAIAAGIRADAYDKVIRYYSKYYNKIENKNYVSFVDFSLPSTKERLFIVNFKNSKISRFLVAHGKNSGELYARNFSNAMDSKKSSLGLYKVQEEYRGENGSSLAMDGLEKTNSNARTRSIVMHQANYVSEEVIREHGRIGRSWGCPALNPKDWALVKPRIKNGSLLLIYK